LTDNAVKNWTLGLIAAPFALASVLAVGAAAQSVEEKPVPAFSGESGTGAARGGEALFKARCSGCHDPAVDRAPSRAALARRFPDDIVAALKTGPMVPMATGLSDLEIGAIADYLTAEAPMKPVADPAPCAAGGRFSMAGPGWNGWSIDPRNWRMQPNPGLTRAEAPRLKVKWAMTYIGGRYGQPTIVGGRLFLTSSSGKIYSLDAKTGCTHWRFDAGAGARTTVVIGRLPGVAPSGYAAYFGDFQRNVYALDAASGKLLWKVNVEKHPRGVLTGAPVLHDGRLYVPLSSWEEAAGGVGVYGCCTARGGVAALNARTGKLIWKTYAIEQEPAPNGKNSSGVQMYGPAGAAVWSSPTIDAKRGVLYVGTGDSYTDVKEGSSDSIIAMDLATGKIRWKNQVTENDSFLMGCGPRRAAANCPTKVGPDHDFGASPILVTLPSGKDIVLAGQKSGVVYGMDPDGGGKTIWRNKVGGGGALGGIEWGMASDGKRLYVANADPGVPESRGGKPGLFALDPATGKQLWFVAAPKVKCGWAGGRCINAQSAAPTVIPGLVLATTSDGHLRAYAAADGAVVWDFDTGGQKYQTINGVKDQGGGTLDVAGPTLAGGMAYIISGYSGPMGGVADNVLLAFSVDGK
jgi:polyvinyl alcohol dehydrogenase (cytochrome)